MEYLTHENEVVSVEFLQIYYRWLVERAIQNIFTSSDFKVSADRLRWIHRYEEEVENVRTAIKKEV